MSTLGFFPWLRLAGEISIGGFLLAPYVRGSAPFAGTNLQVVADKLLETYIERRDAPVAKATVLITDRNHPTRDLNDEEITHAFQLREFLAVAALAERQFFGNDGYCNSHHFHLVLQKFREPFDGINVSSRRRDGTTNSFWGRETFHVARPEHVHPPIVATRVDISVVEALIAAKGQEKFSPISEAILSFNLANTDSAEITERVEVVLLNGSLERLLDCRSGKEQELVKRFLAAVRPMTEMAGADVSRIRTAMAGGKFGSDSTVREVWLRDFFRLRNDLAHGRVVSERKPIWTIKEHLLLGSYLFPLLLKARLAELGTYTFTKDDQLGVDVFERLAASDLFLPEGHPGLPASWPWHKAMDTIREERFRLAFEQIDRSDP